MATNDDMYSRFIDIFNPRLFEKRIAVIGCGATGSNLIDSLVRMGIKPSLITVFDHDRVREHNLPNTIFTITNVGCKKSIVVGEKYGVVAKGRFTIHSNLVCYDVIFNCADTMKVRAMVADKLMPHHMLIDCRVAKYGSQVFAFSGRRAEQYKMTLFPDNEAIPLSCGERMFRPTALVTASLAINQLIKLERGEVIDEIVSMNVNELSVFKERSL